MTGSSRKPSRARQDGKPKTETGKPRLLTIRPRISEGGALRLATILIPTAFWTPPDPWTVRQDSVVLRATAAKRVAERLPPLKGHGWRDAVIL